MGRGGDGRGDGEVMGGDGEREVMGRREVMGGGR